MVQCILHFYVQGSGKLISEMPARRTVDELLGASQQSTCLTEPDVCLRPQSSVVETRDFTESVVLAAMGEAGEVIQRFESRKTVTSTEVLSACFCSSVWRSCGAAAANAVHQERKERSHNVIVPINGELSIRNHKKSERLRPQTLQRFRISKTRHRRAISRLCDSVAQSRAIVK